MSELAIEFKNVDFSFGTHKIFEKLSFSVTDDQFIGIVGANGSGKSTLMKILLGLLHNKAGEINILGAKPGHMKTRPDIGTSLQDIDFPATEKAQEVLKFVCQQHSDSNPVNELIKDFGITDFKNKACGQLSGGMKRRLSLACAFAGKPRILLLDEPTTGLDRESRKNLLKNLRKYQDRNQSLILMISHHPEDVTDSVDQFLHLKNSTVNFVSPEQMREMTKIRKVSFDCNNRLEYANSLKSTYENNRQTVIVKDSDQFIKDLHNMDFPYKNLEIHKLGADELIGEFL